MSLILRIVALPALLLGAVLLYAASKPNIFRVERSQNIEAPPEKIFALINNFHNWPLWAPQDREDATMRRAFSGPESGAGAVSEWTSSGSAGGGRMAIIESAPGQKISVQVDFVKPLAAHNINQFTLQPSGNVTRVTWSMQGTNLFMMKFMSVFVNMDRMAGKHFESGLENLKAAAEK